jgi:subtilisin family serine protease
VIPVCGTDTYVLGLGGTSMAAPHVSGLAALMVEDLGRNPGRIKTAIQNSADDLGQPGTDPAYGKGRINVYNATH